MGEIIKQGGIDVKVLLNIDGLSQYGKDVDERLQNSACGPTTAKVILNAVCQNEPLSQKSVNELYKLLGTTRIGMFKWRFVKKMKKLLGDQYLVADCTVNEAIEELRHGRPVAVKFDKYFSFKWTAKPIFNYHWAVLVGYEIRNDELFLIVHDNGSKKRPSKLREFLYEKNSDVLSFVKIGPHPFET